MATRRRQPTTPAEPPVEFAGPPGRVRAAVTVTNVGERRIAVRDAVVRRVGQPDLPAPALARVAAGSTATVPLSLRLDPATPPGDYEAEVEVAGQVRPAVLRVEADLDVRLSPRRLLVSAGDNAVNLLARNEGNVDIPLATTTRGRLDDGTDRADEGPDVTFVLDGAPVLRAATIEPLRGTLTVPEGLDPTRRHEARVPVGTADLTVVVLPRDPSGPSTPPTRRPASKPGARGSRRRRPSPPEEP